jgi:hypothetical protein
MTLPEWTTVASPVVAAASAAIAMVGAKSARASLRLAQQQEERRHHELNLYLSDAVSRRSSSGRMLSCVVLIANPADSPNTVVSTDLHLHLLKEEGTVIIVKVPPVRGSRSAKGIEKALALPAQIGARSAVSGRIDFELRDAVLGQNRVDQYQLLIRDTEGRAQTLDIPVFRELLERRI